VWSCVVTSSVQVRVPEQRCVLTWTLVLATASFHEVNKFNFQ
jgi:hypothetical protein